MTIGLEECELLIEGHSIKYKRSDEGTQSMLTKMMKDGYLSLKDMKSLLPPKTPINITKTCETTRNA
uniref:Anti-sigma factor n=1 Tax=Caenorhabditis tropicalis TaxID=1561998 RepID=A0A1I7UEU6_9PELO